MNHSKALRDEALGRIGGGSKPLMDTAVVLADIRARAEGLFVKADMTAKHSSDTEIKDYTFAPQNKSGYNL